LKKKIIFNAIYILTEPYGLAADASANSAIICENPVFVGELGKTAVGACTGKVLEEEACNKDPFPTSLFCFHK